MHRSRALLNTILSSLSRNGGGGNSIPKSSALQYRQFAVAAADASSPTASGHSEDDAAKLKKDNAAVDASGAPLQQQPLADRRPLRFGTLQFLLQRRMPINSVRLLASGIRLACDEKAAEEMVPYLGPWMAQVSRPEMLERLMPWAISDMLRDLSRMARFVGIQIVRDALPQKHLQTLANRLVVQGFDKLTPLQLARAADAFSALRPYVKNFKLDHAALDAGIDDAPPPVEHEVWPSSDWVDELIDWMHNLKPNQEPWDRTTCYVLAVILQGLARSHYKPRQPTFQAAATAMKLKMEEQLNSGYMSRRALSNSAVAWNIWKVNPEEYAPGYWDVYFKSVGKVFDEYVDTAPDPPSVEDDLSTVDLEPEEKGRRRAFVPRNSQTLLQKRRELRSLLSTVALAAKNFNLNKQFDEHVKAIWEKRVEEHAQFLNGLDSRRIIHALDGLNVSIKPQTREKLNEISTRFGGRRQNAPREQRDVDEFDDNRGSKWGDKQQHQQQRGMSGSRGGSAGRGGRGEQRDDFDDYEDFKSERAPRGGRGDFDDFKSERAPRGGGRGGGGGTGYARGGRRDDMGYDDKF